MRVAAARSAAAPRRGECGGEGGDARGRAAGRGRRRGRDGPGAARLRGCLPFVAGGTCVPAERSVFWGGGGRDARIRCVARAASFPWRFPGRRAGTGRAQPRPGGWRRSCLPVHLRSGGGGGGGRLAGDAGPSLIPAAPTAGRWGGGPRLPPEAAAGVRQQPALREPPAAAAERRAVALAPASPVTLCSLPVARRFFYVLFFFALGFFFFLFLPSLFLYCPRLSRGGRRFGNVPCGVVKFAERVQLLRILLCCVFTSCFSINVCVRTCSERLGFLKVSEKVQESFTDPLLIFDLNVKTYNSDSCLGSDQRSV